MFPVMELVSRGLHLEIFVRRSTCFSDVTTITVDPVANKRSVLKGHGAPEIEPALVDLLN